MKMSLLKDKLAMWFVCSAIGEQFELIDKILANKKENESNEEIEYEIEFKVNGVELDFERLIRRIDENFRAEVEDRAKLIVSNKFSDIIEAAQEIQKRIEDNKEKFKYDCED